MPVMTTTDLKILVIDDSPVVLKITVLLLQDAGHEVEGLNKPEEALDRVRQLQPDIVVCDIMMPGINGLEVLRLIREDKNLVDVRVVMASAKAYEADRNKAKKLGADGYIVKPFTMEKFDAIVQSLDSMQLSAWGVRGTLPVPQEG